MARSAFAMLKTALLVVAACSLLTGASATFVMLGDSFSDDGRGANPVVQDALCTAAVRLFVKLPLSRHTGTCRDLCLLTQPAPACFMSL